MTGGFDPGRYTAAPLQTEGVIRFTGSPDAVFARIANHGALTDWVPMLKTVQVSHPKPMPPGESTIGTTRVLALRGGVTLREEIVYWDPRAATPIQPKETTGRSAATWGSWA